MKIVYLDQNKWIELARAIHGKDPSGRLSAVLARIRETRDAGTACFPLSLGHYLETLKNTDPGRRQRLASVMRDISGGHTIASSEEIVAHEIDTALACRFPGRVRVGAIELLGHGLGHIYGRMFPALRVRGGHLTPEQRALIENRVSEVIEGALLSGVIPFTAEERPRVDLSALDRRFQEHLDKYAAEVSALTPDIQERITRATALYDIREPLVQALLRHGIDWLEFELLGQSGWRAFLEDMPSRRVDMHLHREWARNKRLRAKSGELNDWAYVGLAAAYCHVVITERHLADLLRRPGLVAHATVITDLVKLAPLLG